MISFIPVLYDDFCGMDIDYVVILINVFGTNKIKRFSILERMLLIILINEMLIEDKIGCNIGDYKKIKGDMYFPHFYKEDLSDYLNLPENNCIDSFVFQQKILNYADINAYNVEGIYDFIKDNWEYDSYSDEMKKNSVLFQ